MYQKYNKEIFSNKNKQRIVLMINYLMKKNKYNIVINNIIQIYHNKIMKL